MKKRPVQDSNEGAGDTANYTPGTLPKRINTVTAEVLACLLESKTLTGLESVFKQNTTRLGAFIHVFERDYNWHIDRKDFAAGTSDGRISYPSAYWLPQATIAQAFEAGAREWIESVKVARAERRKLAGECKVKAAQRNAARKQNPRQDNLWE
jgi:hypothetical protein